MLPINQGVYYVNKKDRTLIPSFVIIINCFELFCYTKCLVTCKNYTSLFQKCIMQERWIFHGLRFSTFYKSSSIEVALKTVYDSKPSSSEDILATDVFTT